MIGVHFERNVGHHLEQFTLEAQYRTRDVTVVGTHVGVYERIGKHAIEGPPERPEGRREFVDGHAGRERREHLVEIAEVYRISGNRRNLGVHRDKKPQRLVEISGCRQLEKTRALFNGALIVGQQIPSPIRGMTFEHVADNPLVECAGAVLADVWCLERFLGKIGKPRHALVVCQRTVANQVTCHGAHFGHFHRTAPCSTARSTICETVRCLAHSLQATAEVQQGQRSLSRNFLIPTCQELASTPRLSGSDQSVVTAMTASITIQPAAGKACILSRCASG